jgi:hypothetical protein
MAFAFLLNIEGGIIAKFNYNKLKTFTQFPQYVTLIPHSMMVQLFNERNIPGNLFLRLRENKLQATVYPLGVIP